MWHFDHADWRTCGRDLFEQHRAAVRAQWEQLMLPDVKIDVTNQQLAAQSITAGSRLVTMPDDDELKTKLQRCMNSIPVVFELTDYADIEENDMQPPQLARASMHQQQRLELHRIDIDGGLEFSGATWASITRCSRTFLEALLSSDTSCAIDAQPRLASDHEAREYAEFENSFRSGPSKPSSEPVTPLLLSRPQRTLETYCLKLDRSDFENKKSIVHSLQIASKTIAERLNFQEPVTINGQCLDLFNGPNEVDQPAWATEDWKEGVPESRDDLRPSGVDVNSPNRPLMLQRVPQEPLLETLACVRLFQQARNIYKAMVRLNVKSWLPGEDSHTNPIWTEAKTSDFDDAHIDGENCDDSVRQVQLPMAVLDRDESLVRNALDRLKNHCDSFVVNVLRSPAIFPSSSIEGVAMRLMPIWCLNITEDALCEYREDIAQEVKQDTPNEATNSLDATTEHRECCDASEARLPSSPSIIPMPIATETLVKSTIHDDYTFTTDQRPVATDELISAFVGASTTVMTVPDDDSPEPGDDAMSTREEVANKLCRPAIWELLRVKLLKFDPRSSLNSLKYVSLEKLSAVISQLQSRLRSAKLSPSSTTHQRMIEDATHFRQALWIYTLKIAVVCEEKGSTLASSELIRRILMSPKYRKSLGCVHVTALRDNWTINGPIFDNSMVAQSSYIQDTSCRDSDKTPAIPPADLAAVRLICSEDFLKKEELLEELCSDHDVSIVERAYQTPISLVVDEINGICIIDQDTFADEETMKQLTYRLAATESQFHNISIVFEMDIDKGCSSTHETNMHAFLAALVHFKSQIRTFLCSTTTECAGLIRRIVDACADSAANERRILPRMWYERPFLLEDESQHERFLTSTQVLNPLAAQSLLHRLGLNDLMSKSQGEIMILAQGAITETQAEALWSIMHTNHGLEFHDSRQ